jgi:starch phosphorylase
VPTIRTYYVRPSLPKVLQPLDTIARNLWWSWNNTAVELFQRIDRDLWEAIDHNPLALLSRVGQGQLEAAAADEGFLDQLAQVSNNLKTYLETPHTWFSRNGADQPAQRAGVIPAEAYPAQRVGYFSAEFGIHESLPIYSGGLGILAGDHLKSASDLGVPLVGVSLLYREAFHQYLNSDGWQQEIHPETDISLLPATLQKDTNGQPILIQCALPGRTLYARIWRVDVGRVPLFLLDANLPQNAPEDQRITDRLYGGDLDMRMRQEILLGIGGLRALQALGLPPTVCHMNEGHSAFLALERVRQLSRDRGLSFPEAREAASAGNVFTTHTPVPAGNDRFPPEFMERYFGSWYTEAGLGKEEFLSLGREDVTDAAESFCMTVLALKLASRSNGVAKLHGEVSRNMWKRVFPGVPQHEIPISSITNGIHQRSFVSPEMRRLYDGYLGPRWVNEPEDPTTWERIDRIPAEELWNAHERARERVVGFARSRLARQVARRGAGAKAVSEALEVLDPKAFTIGFARRFATYKRANLVLRDPVRLLKILNNPNRPVQILFSGKAHQKDEPGKELIRKVVHLAQQPEFRHKIVFIEDYDINVARHLVQGVDIWLNTPIRPLEASGTSGMKSIANGGIHVSVLDGWWAEAYNRSVGWAVGEAEEYADKDVAERIEADMLYHRLETEIVPLFYQRGRDGLPRDWVELMRTSIKQLAPIFNTHRMVRQYFEEAYHPASKRFSKLLSSDSAPAKALAEYKKRVLSGWERVGIRSVEGTVADVIVGQPLRVQARAALGDLTPDDVDVQLFHGAVDIRGELLDGAPLPMKLLNRDGDGTYVYAGELAPRQSGRYGYSVRVLPRHEDLSNPFDFAPVRWG